MARKGWAEEDLVGRRKGDAFKVWLAPELSEKTTVTVAWIATRLHMGTRGHLTHLLSDLSKRGVLVRRRSQLESPICRPEVTAVDARSRLA